MSDAAHDQKQVGRKCLEEHCGKGVLLVHIWREVLRVIFAGELRRLDDFKREMWFLLVAAGSGYLARCWHKTLRAKPLTDLPKPQLTDYPHVDPQDPRQEPMGNNNSTTLLLLEDASPNVSQLNSPASLGKEVTPKSAKRNFSPKGLSKKLFSSDSSKSGKSFKKKAEAKGSSADEDNRSIGPAAEKSQDGSGGKSTKKSPWSSFKSKTSREGSSEGNFGESPSSLKRTGDAFHKSMERRRSDSGSSSSRNLQAILGEESNGMGSSRSEAGATDLTCSSARLTVRSLSGAFDVAKAAEPGEVGLSGNLPEVASSQLRSKVVENEAKPTLSNALESSGKKNVQGSGNSVNNNGSSILSVSSVAEVVARLEKGNLSVKPANQGKVQVAVIDRGKGRALKLESIEQNFAVEEEVLPGGRGKRRADAGKVAVDGEGKALPALLSGKRTKDFKDSNVPEPLDLGGFTLTSIFGKRMKDNAKPKEEESGNADEPSTSSLFGDMDLSQVFFGLDGAFFGAPKEEKSPFKYYKRSKYMSQGPMRKMRESPRPVSALESCLRAQFPLKDGGSRVARSLNFSSLIGSRGQRRESLEPGSEAPFLDGDWLSPSSNGRGLGGSEQQSPQTEGALGLPLLKTPPVRRGGQFYERGERLIGSASKYPRRVVVEDRGSVVSSQSKLDDVLWRPTTLPVALKKRKVSQACSPSTSSTNIKSKGYELEALVIPPMEGLLFSFGVGIGVMSLIDGPNGEVERLSRELQESEAKMEKLNNLLRQARDSSVEASRMLSKQVMVADSFSTEGIIGEVSGNSEPLAGSPAVDETGGEMFDLFRREAPETPQQIEHMAELEAELEAELDTLTNGVPEASSGRPDFEELDPEGVAGVADRDLGVEGLPAVLDWDDDNDDFITEQPAYIGGGVPPRELSRLLRKVQSSWQEHRIAELEEDLHEKAEKLQMLEREVQSLTEKKMSIAPSSAGIGVEGSGSVAKDVSESLVNGDKKSPNAQIQQLDYNVFQDQDYLSDENDSVHHESGMVTDVTHETEEESDEPSFHVTVRHDLGSSLLGSAAREPVSSSTISLDREDGANFQGSVASETGSSVRGSVSSLMLSEESMDCNAEADNDDICDEFLNSVFGSPEGGQVTGSSGVSSPLISALRTPPSLNQDSKTGEDNPTVIITDFEDAPLHTEVSGTVEDLDQVVGELLKRDSSSVKNAINAFLLWEAETDEGPTKDEMAEEDTIAGFSRRTAGKNPTPQKTPSSNSSPQKPSIISARLEQLARSAFTSEKMPYVDRHGGILKRLGASNSDDKKGTKLAAESLDVFQPPVPKVEEKATTRFFGLWDQPSRKDQSSQTSRREGGKFDTSTTDHGRDLFRSESPVFGGADRVDRDFQALLDTRRELRYSSAKVQLSYSGASQDRDTVPVFRQREDASRAGTNSPIGRQGSRKLYQSPKTRSSRMSLDNRLYQNPTSDWLSEVGSPPDI